MELFDKVTPKGTTPLEIKLQKLLNPYLDKVETNENPKPVNYLVITDGIPSECHTCF